MEATTSRIINARFIGNSDCQKIMILFKIFWNPYKKGILYWECPTGVYGVECLMFRAWGRGLKVYGAYFGLVEPHLRSCNARLYSAKTGPKPGNTT